MTVQGEDATSKAYLDAAITEREALTAKRGCMRRSRRRRGADPGSRAEGR
jgi:hypothetical protein